MIWWIGGPDRRLHAIDRFTRRATGTGWHETCCGLALLPIPVALPEEPVPCGNCQAAVGHGPPDEDDF
ncbi:hypothetical protein GCM10012275_24550 [Longimycelium tulufanense]|uniref:Uncharacterized protein n=1 Tax=Longimycelium tulufanense TaxID=907463 RepID=A0A8J3CDW9_9PSEU|nr:hypothetical protein [Longimycelium tulufanense]GGM52657.1 hypothetical protein GCM10012275_24550 [Longimycelium tulufanense]